jgi:hypothetical protein
MTHALMDARRIAKRLPCAQAQTLRSILSLRTSPAKHRTLIVRSGLPLGALMVAESFHGLQRHLRRCL